MSYSAQENGAGGVECPACDHVAPFRRFAELEECPDCGTSLSRLVGPRR